MTQSAYFSAAHRNAALSILTYQSSYGYMYQNGNVGSFADAASQLRLYSSEFGDTSVPLDVSLTNIGSGAYWGSAIGGTMPFAMAYDPNSAGGVAKWARWDLSYAGTHTYVDGLVTVAGGGGMIIAPSTTFVLNERQIITGVLSMPLNNSNTLRINGALANAIITPMVFSTTPGPRLCLSPYYVAVYGGTQPATADTGITNQTLLFGANWALGSSSFAAPSGGSIQLATSIGSTGTNSGNGTATWFRWIRGNMVMDGSVGLGGSGTDMIINNTAIVAGATPPALTGLTFTFP